VLYAQHTRIVALAAEYLLPPIYQAREFVDAGGLMSYGMNLADFFRHSATYCCKNP
jgi:putative ABC transport system substrate-binding protein